MQGWSIPISLHQCVLLLTSHDEEEEHHDEGGAKVEQVAKDASDGSLQGQVV